jgi:hypothetical protein
MADPRSIRTNNPGAMNYGPFAQKWGAISTDGRLAVFPDQETGFKAMGGLLDLYRDKHGLDSVSGIINRWAPRQYDNNSTDTYIRTVASKLGVDPNTPVSPDKRNALMEAMATYEAGRPVTMGGASQPQPITPTGAAAMAAPVDYSNMPSPEQVAMSRRMGQQLMQQGTSTEPVGHWTQALARVLQGGVGRAHMSEADAMSQQRNQALIGALSGTEMGAALGPADRAMLASNPELMQSVYGRTLSNRLDPNAKMEAERLRLGVEGMRQTQQHQSQMGPLQLELERAKIDQAKQKDAIDQIIMQQMQGGLQPSAPASAAPIQPMSAIPGNDPNLIRTQAAPQSPMPAPTSPDMVQTPIGPMPPQRAKQLGFMMAMRGKAEAGKMIAEPADKFQLAKEARNEIDKRELNTVEQMGRLTAISAGFKSKFLTLPEQAKQYAMSWQEWLTGKLPPAQQTARAEYVEFQQNTVNNLSNYIKEITGAAMGVEEAKRIMSGMPNMSDDPTAFKAKLDNIQSQVMLSMARYRYLRENGFKGQPWDVNRASQDMPLNQMRKTIHDRRDQIVSEIRTEFPNAPEPDVRSAVKARIAQEFGISI